MMERRRAEDDVTAIGLRFPFSVSAFDRMDLAVAKLVVRAVESGDESFVLQERSLPVSERLGGILCHALILHEVRAYSGAPPP